MTNAYIYHFGDSVKRFNNLIEALKAMQSDYKDQFDLIIEEHGDLDRISDQVMPQLAIMTEAVRPWAYTGESTNWITLDGSMSAYSPTFNIGLQCPINADERAELVQFCESNKLSYKDSTF